MAKRWEDLKIEDATDDEFEAMRQKKPGKGIDPRITEVLDAVEQGSRKKVTVPDESQLRGLRVALGREAAKRGFRLEYHWQGPVMIVTKSDEPLRPRTYSQPGTSTGRKRGRPRKETESQDTSLQAGMTEVME